MKKLYVAALAVLLAVGVSGAAQATPTPVDAPISTGTLKASLLNQTFVATKADDSEVFSGLYNHWVWENTTGLAFLYQFKIDNDNPKRPVGRWTSIDFYEFPAVTNGIGYDMNGDAADSTWSSLTGSWASTTGSDPFSMGDDGYGTIGWNFAEGTNPTRYHMLPGYTSPLLWVQTKAWYYTLASSSIIDGGTCNVDTYGPAAPEPTSMLLMSIGLIGIAGRRIQKRFKA